MKNKRRNEQRWLFIGSAFWMILAIVSGIDSNWGVAALEFLISVLHINILIGSKLTETLEALVEVQRQNLELLRRLKR